MSPRVAGPSVLAMRNYLAVAVLLALAAAPGAAAADELELPDGMRSDKRFLVGASPVDVFTVMTPLPRAPLPLSTLRFSLQVAPRTSLDLGMGAMPLHHEQDISNILLGQLGVRRFLSDGPWAPYLLARAGALLIDFSDSSDLITPFAAAGGGLEYTHVSGFSVWAELALGAIRVGRSETELLPSLNSNVGVGYRFAGLDG